MRSTAIRALSGMLAVASALAAGHLLSGLVEQNASPFLAVGNTAIDLTPEPVKALAIRWFGESDKLVLLAGMAVVIGLLAAVAGLVSRSGPAPGAVLIAAFGLLGVVAAAARPDVGVLGMLPSLAATVAGVGAFVALHRSASEAEPPAGRRRFLLTAGGLAAGSLIGALGGSALAQRPDGRAREALARRVPAPQPIPGGADFAANGTPAFRTSNADFYRVDTALAVPRVDPDSWRLRVHGMVDRELALSLDDLLRRPQETRTITMTCVSNEVGGPYTSTADFTGVPIRDVLREAGVRPGAEQVFSTSIDGYTAGTPVDVLADPDRPALLAYGMNGEPLPAEHGFPVRMVTSGLYGYVSATKWLVDLELTTFDRETYWEQRGWAQRAPIKAQSRIDRPKPFEKVPAGRFTAAGTAWAQPHGIARVEVRVDGGPWRDAQLSTEVSGHTWRMWRAELELPPGGRTVECRATDRAGTTQTPQRVPTVPDGATGWHSIFCTAR
ncbi:molybdopterin-dependent oxidoreductase [Saccharopolyspora sp. TS4A08]|uniref:Molybdopterin-dependent oxidoreductase n=1 Tax=Saccharopolyspora ipomoeae TaxID=3042027 RepID=A0ABT6PLK3_9PSEU|nr:molybdopterin-dependent oxidoreductase [Saccharopolyspora sp. TS4A08]MDI2028879.1 molybdopterin-dependent oxidoreductase [Saccharopolyspora sp. TS4A08]